jgi:phosphopantetheinyl transferase
VATDLHARPVDLVDLLLEGPPITWAEAGATIRCFGRARSAPYASDLFRALPAAEQHAVEVIRHPSRRQARAMGHGLVRCVLSLVAADDVAPEEWELAPGPWGKPRVVGPVAAPEFSVSYGDDVMAIATATDHDLGIDLEPVTPRRTPEIPWLALCEREQQVLRSLTGPERYERFVRMWTLKEAFTKCLGVGSALDFASVETAFAPPRVKSRPTDAARGRDFAFLQQRLVLDGRRHYVAVTAASRA